MTIPDEELLISRPPEFEQRTPSARLSSPRPIQIECHAEERHFINSNPLKIKGTSKPIRFTTNNEVRPGQYRSEIVVHNNPDMDLYIKKLRVAFHTQDDSSIHSRKTARPSSRSHSLHVSSQEKQHGKHRATTLPRSNSQAVLHQCIDDICSNEKLMANENICFFLKNGEFLARI